MFLFSGGQDISPVQLEVPFAVFESAGENHFGIVRHYGELKDPLRQTSTYHPEEPRLEIRKAVSVNQ